MRRLALLLVLAAFAAPAFAQLPTIEAKTEGMTRMDGFVPLYWDANEGKLYLEIGEWETDLLYSVGLPAGLGSNDVGLDRTQLGRERVVRFGRVGPKVLLRQPNLRFRTSTGNEAEAASVRDAFAPSVVYGFTAVAETPRRNAQPRVLVDATALALRDAHGVADRLKGTGQGSFRLDASRSALHLARTKAFPDNTEIEAELTFETDSPGRYVRDVAADPSAVTLRVRQSFVRLPDMDAPSAYQPRRFHPGSGYFPTTYADYSVPIGEDMTQRFITRHDLRCADAPGADGLCTPAEPIVYYLDPGTPEPVRSALLDGARWWNEAFTAAGFRDGFQMRMLPDDADPMDVRYNVIQWVHRATRGWSYGASVVDPRTGEILKGHVSLGSLRVRQDYLIAEGLLAPYSGADARGISDERDPMLRMALARIRQLSAHEIGHTIGIAHNFAASADGRASVMDYPAPLASVASGREPGAVDLDEAYATGMGAWDVAAVRYGYTPVAAEADAGDALLAILEEARESGLHYITDTDARPTGGAHPGAHLWDNSGAGAMAVVESLAQEIAVREVALERFGAAVIRDGRPLAMLEEALVPLYLRHRYQAEAVAKLVGGVEYGYAVRGEASEADAPRAVDAQAQRAALSALLALLEPSALAVPEPARRLIAPRPPGYYGNRRERFDGDTGLTFDAVAPSEAVAALVASLLLHPQRAARLVQQADFDAGQLGFAEVLGRATTSLFAAPPADTYHAALARRAQAVWVDGLTALTADTDAAPEVRALAESELRALVARLGATGARAPRSDSETAAHATFLTAEIARFLARDYAEPTQRGTRLDIPPGSPIGSGYAERLGWLRRHADGEACAWREDRNP